MNQRCSDFRERLGAYLDGELEESSARETELHLEGCPSCRSTLEEMRTTDRLLREGLAGEEIDIERSEYSLAETLERIRQEPSPAWEPERPKRRRGWVFGWNWRLRWVAGIAAATAAVFLALRIGPEPMAPEKPRSIPHVQTEETAGGKGAPSEPEPRITLPDAEWAGATDEVEIQRPATAAEPRANGVVSEESEQKPAGFLEEAIPAAPAVEPKPEGTRDAVLLEPEQPEPRIRGGRGEPLQTDAPREVGTVAAEKKAHLQQSIPERMLAEDGWREDAVMASAIADDTWKWGISESDTLGPTTGWPERLEAETRHLRHTPEKERDRAERAHRWRTIGDLWEWIGRQEDSPTAFAKAVEAYRMAAETDPRAAGLDSTRVQRARVRSAEEIEGNILPAER